MTIEELKQELADILGVEPGELTEGTTNQSLASWDSMAALRVISFLDDQLDEQVEPEEAESLTSVGAILEFARKRGIVD